MSNDNCHTPQEFFNKLNAVYNFRLDAAADKENTKCDKFITKEDNALAIPWVSEGWVWLNPPYSKEAGGILTWIKKAHTEVVEGNCLGVVCLIICDVSAQSRQYAWDNAYEIVELSPRINFMSPGKDNRKGGMQAYQLVIFDKTFLPHDSRFIAPTCISRWNWKKEYYKRRSSRTYSKSSTIT